MYFAQFQSYEAAMADAKTFCVEVLTSSHKIRSSDMPMAVLKIVTDYIEICEETRTSFYIWDHQAKCITMIPYHSIVSLKTIILA
jgi:hypothetical protein